MQVCAQSRRSMRSRLVSLSCVPAQVLLEKVRQRPLRRQRLPDDILDVGLVGVVREADGPVSDVHRPADELRGDQDPVAGEGVCVEVDHRRPSLIKRDFLS